MAWAVTFAVIVGGAVYASGGSRPQDPVDPAVRQVVESQLQAFAAEDAGKAFALTDPTLRTRFGGDAETFLATVRSQYPMVLKPASVLFLKPASDGTIALQKVRLTDADGTNWLLTYLLRQQDHQWRIAGTIIEPEGAQVVT